MTTGKALSAGAKPQRRKKAIARNRVKAATVRPLPKWANFFHIGGLGDHFSPLDSKWKLFARRGTDVSQVLPAEFTSHAPRFEPSSIDVRRVVPSAPGKAISLMLEKALLSPFAPANAIVNDQVDVLYLRGRTGDYLEPAPGQPRWNILEMAREGLQIELSSALRHLGRHQKEVQSREGEWRQIPISPTRGWGDTP